MARLSKPRHKSTPAELATNHFKKLSDSDREEFHWLLADRKTVISDLIPLVQGRWGLFDKLAAATVRQRIYAYREHVLLPSLDGKEVDSNQQLVTVEQRINTMQELSSLIVMHKKRIERALQIELLTDVATSKISAAIRRDIKIMGDLLEKLSKLQLETGEIKRAPKVITGEFGSNLDDPRRMTFQVTEEFLKTLDGIEGEFIDSQPVIDVQEEPNVET